MTIQGEIADIPSRQRSQASPQAAPRVLTLPVAAGERELRLDLFRGAALWLIFIDHLPTNILTWFTIRNYGFSDATEIFIFISGYTAAFVYSRTMQERGFLVGKSTSRTFFFSRSISPKFLMLRTVLKIRFTQRK